MSEEHGVEEAGERRVKMYGETGQRNASLLTRSEKRVKIKRDRGGSEGEK